MELRVVFGRGRPTITVAGDLDVSSAATFTPLVLGLRNQFGPDATYDFTDVVTRDAAGRSTLGQIAHEFREHGRVVTFPDGEGTPEGTGTP